MLIKRHWSFSALNQLLLDDCSLASLLYNNNLCYTCHFYHNSVRTCNVAKYVFPPENLRHNQHSKSVDHVKT